MSVSSGLIYFALASTLLMLGVSVASGAADSASGSLTVGAERFALKYVFAVMQEDKLAAAGKQKLSVFLSDQPVPHDLRKASDDWLFWASQQARAGVLHGAVLVIDPATGVWRRGQVSTSRGFAFYTESVSSPDLGSLRFAPSGPIGDAVAGKVSMTAPMPGVQDGDAPWRIEAEFRAAVAHPAAVSGELTGAAAQSSPQYKAVLAFLDACRKKDVAAIQNSVDPRSRETLTQMLAASKDQALAMFAEMATQTAALKLSKVTVRGDAAELEFTGPTAGSGQSLRVVLVKGEWKLAQ